MKHHKATKERAPRAQSHISKSAKTLWFPWPPPPPPLQPPLIHCNPGGNPTYKHNERFVDWEKLSTILLILRVVTAIYYQRNRDPKDSTERATVKPLFFHPFTRMQANSRNLIPKSAFMKPNPSNPICWLGTGRRRKWIHFHWRRFTSPKQAAGLPTGNWRRFLRVGVASASRGGSQHLQLYKSRYTDPVPVSSFHMSTTQASYTINALNLQSACLLLSKSMMLYGFSSNSKQTQGWNHPITSKRDKETTPKAVHGTSFGRSRKITIVECLYYLRDLLNTNFNKYNTHMIPIMNVANNLHITLIFPHCPFNCYFLANFVATRAPVTFCWMPTLTLLKEQNLMILFWLKSLLVKNQRSNNKEARTRTDEVGMLLVLFQRLNFITSKWLHGEVSNLDFHNIKFALTYWRCKTYKLSLMFTLITCKRESLKAINMLLKPNVLQVFFKASKRTKPTPTTMSTPETRTIDQFLREIAYYTNMKLQTRSFLNRAYKNYYKGILNPIFVFHILLFSAVVVLFPLWMQVTYVSCKNKTLSTPSTHIMFFTVLWPTGFLWSQASKGLHTRCLYQKTMPTSQESENTNQDIDNNPIEKKSACNSRTSKIEIQTNRRKQTGG